MTRARCQVLVLAKEPVAGRVKTRLCPPYTPAQAAELAAAALTDTLAAVSAAPVTRRVLCLDGSARGVAGLPADYDVVPQRRGALGTRIASAFADANPGGWVPTLLVGMDTPQLTPAGLGSACSALLDGADAVLGLASDGGWWSLGLRSRPGSGLVALFDGVPMSTDRAGREQRAVLMSAGLSVTDLPVLRDVDTASDAVEVAAAAPGSRFAFVLAHLSCLPVSSVVG